MPRSVLAHLRFLAALTALALTTGCLGLFGQDRASRELPSVTAPPTAEPRSPVIPRKTKTVSAEKQSALEREYELGVQAYEANRPVEATERLAAVYREMPALKEVRSYLKRAYLALGMQHYTYGEIEESIRVWNLILFIDSRDAQAHAYIRRAQEEVSRLPSSSIGKR